MEPGHDPQPAANLGALQRMWNEWYVSQWLITRVVVGLHTQAAAARANGASGSGRTKTKPEQREQDNAEEQDHGAVQQVMSRKSCLKRPVFEGSHLQGEERWLPFLCSRKFRVWCFSLCMQMCVVTNQSEQQRC